MGEKEVIQMLICILSYFLIFNFCVPTSDKFDGLNQRVIRPSDLLVVFLSQLVCPIYQPTFSHVLVLLCHTLMYTRRFI